MEKKIRLMLKVVKAIIEIFEIEIDERIERMKKDEHKLEEGGESDYNSSRNYLDRFTNQR